MVLSIFFLLVRSVNLLEQPLYLDEGIYISWASLVSESPGFAYISLQDGKTPLFIWLISLLNNNNSLFVARIISVFSGLITILCWILIMRLYKADQSLQVLTWLIFLTAPFLVFMQRMGFSDSLLTALASVSLLTLIFAKVNINKHIAFSFLLFFVSGLFLGMAFLTKTSAKIFLIAEIIIAFSWTVSLLRIKKIKSALFFVIATALFYLPYHELTTYLRIGSHRFWGSIATKENELTFSVKEIFMNFTSTHNFIAYSQNFPLFIQYFAIYFGPFLFFSLIGIVIIIRKQRDLLWLPFYSIF